MNTVNVDIAVVGAGGAGLRAAIAAAQADPSLSIALVSKVYPMRSHTGGLPQDRRAGRPRNEVTSQRGQ